MMNKLIVVVDDEPDIVKLITYHLKKEGFKVRGFMMVRLYLPLLRILFSIL